MSRDMAAKRRTVVALVFLIVLAVSGALILNILSSATDHNFVRGIDIDKGDKKIAWGRYEEFDLELTESVEIKQSGVYHLTGTLQNGMVIVDVGDYEGVTKLILDNVTINNDTGPAIYVKSADDIVIETAEGTTNSLSSGENFDVFEEDEDVEGVIYSKGDLSFYGNGKIFVESKYGDAIVSKDDLTIRSGELEIIAADDGIRGKDSVFIENGTIKIKSKQNGIKSTNDKKPGKGFVYVENGNLEIEAGDDGVHATTNLIVMGGKIDIIKSYEGLEGAKVAIDGGEVDIFAIDDGVNAAGGNDQSAFMRPGAEDFAEQKEYYIVINGGKLHINAAGDGLDSNGKIYINGGEIVIDGPINASNGAIDADAEIFLNGGEVLGVDASRDTVDFANDSLCNGLEYYFEETQQKGTEIEIRDATSNITIMRYQTLKNFNHLVLGSERLEKGKVYAVYANGEMVSEIEMSDSMTKSGEPARRDAWGNGMQPKTPAEEPEEADLPEELPKP